MPNHSIHVAPYKVNSMQHLLRHSDPDPPPSTSAAPLSPSTAQRHLDTLRSRSSTSLLPGLISTLVEHTAIDSSSDDGAETLGSLVDPLRLVAQIVFRHHEARLEAWIRSRQQTDHAWTEVGGMMRT